MAEKDELDVLLDQWQNVPARDPQLTHRVWTRIAGDSRGNLPAQNWMTRLFDALSSPVTATAFVAACIALGLMMAQTQVSQAKQQRTEELAERYMELITSQQSISVAEVSR